MKVWGTVKNLNLKQLWKLILLCAANINRLWPTWQATKMSVTLADTYFGTRHNKNTPANAFRHAVWNYLVAKRCYRSDQPMEKVLEWTRQITDLHEDLFPNAALARAMDLHNNKVGRLVFSKNSELKEEDMIRLLLDKTEESSLIDSMEELRDLDKDQLAHIETTNS